MAIKVKIHRSAVRELMRNESLVVPRAEAIAEECNGESAWGGYSASNATSKIRARAYVTIDDPTDQRVQRAIRNLGAGG